MKITRRTLVAGLAASSFMALPIGRAFAQTKPLRIAYVVPGTLGDKGFLDQGNVGIERAASELGATVRVIQGNPQDPQEWKRNLQAASDGSYDVIVSGGSGPIIDVFGEVAKANPDRTFVFFAGTVDAPNVASIGFLYHEGSYLAGVLGGLIATRPDLFPLSKGSGKVGVVAGLDIPPINAFLAGYQQGAQSVDAEVQMLRTYSGTFSDPNKGYAQTQALYQDGADVVYAVAGGTGLGVLRASSEANKYSIGVDTDQNDLFPGHVAASMALDIGEALIQSFKAFSAGTLKTGVETSFGVADGGVRLIVAKDIVPQEAQDVIDSARDRIASGEINVVSVL